MWDTHAPEASRFFLSCSRFGPLGDVARGLKLLSNLSDEMFFLASFQVTQARTASSSSIPMFCFLRGPVELRQHIVQFFVFHPLLQSDIRFFNQIFTLVYYMRELFRRGQIMRKGGTEGLSDVLFGV